MNHQTLSFEPELELHLSILLYWYPHLKPSQLYGTFSYRIWNQCFLITPKDIDCAFNRISKNRSSLNAIKERVGSQKEWVDQWRYYESITNKLQEEADNIRLKSICDEALSLKMK